MTDSAGKQLSGLARSIDALFDPVGQGPVPVPAAVDAAADPDPAPSVDPPEFGAFDVASPFVDDVVTPTESGEAVTSEVEAGEADLDSALEFGSPAGDIADSALGFGPGADVTDSALASTTAEATEPGDETPLGQAVAAYLAGDRDRAAQIGSLATECLERKDLDAAARALCALAAAAGDPPDTSIMEVAAPLRVQPVLTRIARQLGSERDEGRRSEYHAICRALGEPMAVAIRDELADSTERFARRVHCEALAKMGSASRSVVESMAVDENRFLVRNAVTILAEVGGERAIEMITSALANPDARVRREALRALTRLGAEDAGQFVMGLLEDPDEGVRLAAAIAAGELGVERALKSVLGMLEGSNDPDTAIPLIRALGHLGDPGAVTAIEKHAVRTLFSKPRPDVRIAAYRALHQIGTPHARRLLNQAVNDKDGDVKAAVKEILHMR